MPAVKFLTTGMQDAINPQEGVDSLDTFIRQAVGKEPLYSFSRTGDNPTQWIQLLHNFDQQDHLTGWPLLAPVRVQMQKCDKCAREFCSTINYRRHIRKHRRSMKFHKEPQKYRDLLGAFWDKLSYNESKEITSFDDVNLEEVAGSSIVKNIAVNLRKTVFLSLPQVYVKAGSALVDIVQGRPYRLTLSSEELFNVLDDASEGTFLCSGTDDSLMKYVFDGDATKIGLEMKNLIACTSFLLEQKLVKAWLADKDAEALRCQKLLVEEEEAAQRRQAKIIERKRQRKIRKKEERAKDRSNGLNVDVYTPDVSASIVSEDTSSSQISSEAINLISDDVIDIDTPLSHIQFSANDDVIDIDQSDVLPNEKQKSSHQFVARWQVPKSQRGSRNGFRGNYNNGNKMIKREQPHKHREQRGVGNSKIWTKKPKPENGVKSRVDDDAINQTSQLMIGSISVTLRNSTGQHQVNSPAEFQENDNTEIKMKSDINLGPQHDTTVRLTDGQQLEDGGKLEQIPFSIDAAKAFLSRRWKEAISGDHIDLVLTSAPEPPGQNHVLAQQHKFRTKPEKNIKTKYIRKQRDVN